MSASSAVECGLTFCQDSHRQMSYPKLSPLALDLVAAPGVCGEGVFRLRGPVRQKTEQDKCKP